MDSRDLKYGHMDCFVNPLAPVLAGRNNPMPALAPTELVGAGAEFMAGYVEGC